MYDLIIIGAGPAGLTAGIYAQRANLKTLILEKENIGGQISSSPLVENYPGFSSISGAELSNNMFNQILDLGVNFEIEEVTKIEQGNYWKVKTDLNEYETKSIIIATGAKHRSLEIENEMELYGKGVHFCATCDGPFYKDKVVAVVGGANTAVQNAIYLSTICKKVYLIYRKSVLRAEKQLIKKLESISNIEILYNSNVIKYYGEELNAIEVNVDGKIKKITLQGLFLSIGLVPNIDIAKEFIDISEDGAFDCDCLTTKEGLFVAGDCRKKSVRQLTTAVNDGTIAAMLAIDYVNNK